MKSDFHKSKNRKDGLYNQCKVCRKECYHENFVKVKKNLDNRDKISIRHKYYELKNHHKVIARIKFYSIFRYETDINFRLISTTRSRIRQVLNGKSKSISTKEILGVEIDTCSKWIENQFTREMNWSNTEVDHVKPVCLYDVLKMKN